MIEEKFNHICDGMVFVIKKIIAAMLLAMLLVVVFQVFWRDILGKPSPWTEEISTYLITYITYIGGIAVMIRGEHIAIDLVTEHVGVRFKAFFQILYQIVYLFVCSYMTYFGFQMIMNPMIQKQVSIATEIPRVYIYAIMPICMGICIIICLMKLIFLIRHFIMKDYDKVIVEQDIDDDKPAATLN